MYMEALHYVLIVRLQMFRRSCEHCSFSLLFRYSCANAAFNLVNNADDTDNHVFLPATCQWSQTWSMTDRPSETYECRRK